jgi:predicted Zn-dependent protease
MMKAVIAMLLVAAVSRGVSTIEKQIGAGDYRAALAALQATPVSERDARWHLLASKVWDGIQDPAKAVAEAQEAINLDPRNEASRLQLAQVFLTHNTPQPAAEILSDALPLFPNSTMIRLGLGIALNQLQRYDEAIRVLTDCLRLKPDFGPAFEALGSAYLDSLDFAKLLKEAGAYTRRNPGDYRGHYYEAAARDKLAMKGAETESLLRRSLALNPGFVAATALLGKVLLDSGRTAEAAGALEEAIRLGPNYKPAHLYLGIAYRKLGRMQDAKRESAELSRLNEEQNRVPPHLRYHRGSQSAAPKTPDQK